jgi:hypothetical protein
MVFPIVIGESRDNLVQHILCAAGCRDEIGLELEPIFLLEVPVQRRAGFCVESSELFYQPCLFIAVKVRFFANT